MKKLLYILPMVLLMGFVLKKPATSNKIVVDDTVVEFGDSGLIINGDTLRIKATYKDTKKVLGIPDQTNKKSWVDHYESGINISYLTEKMDSVKEVMIGYPGSLLVKFGSAPYSGDFILFGELIKRETTSDKLLKTFKDEGLRKPYKNDTLTIERKGLLLVIAFSDSGIDSLLILFKKAS